MADEPVQEPPQPEVDDSDLGASIPALHTNRFYIAMAGDHICRMTFGEVASGSNRTQWRTAHLMTAQDLLGLADLINDVVGHARPSDKKDG